MSRSQYCTCLYYYCSFWSHRCDRKVNLYVDCLYISKVIVAYLLHTLRYVQDMYLNVYFLYNSVRISVFFASCLNLSKESNSFWLYHIRYCGDDLLVLSETTLWASLSRSDFSIIVFSTDHWLACLLWLVVVSVFASLCLFKSFDLMLCSKN